MNRPEGGDEMEGQGHALTDDVLACTHVSGVGRSECCASKFSSVGITAHHLDKVCPPSIERERGDRPPRVSGGICGKPAQDRLHVEQREVLVFRPLIRREVLTERPLQVIASLNERFAHFPVGNGMEQVNVERADKVVGQRRIIDAVADGDDRVVETTPQARVVAYGLPKTVEVVVRNPMRSGRGARRTVIIGRDRTARTASVKPQSGAQLRPCRRILGYPTSGAKSFIPKVR